MGIRNPKQGRSAFAEAFDDARKRGVSSFTFEGKRYTTQRADRPNERLTVKDYGDESERMARRTPAPAQVKKRSSFNPEDVEEGLSPVRPEEFLGGAGKIAAAGLSALGAGAAVRAGMKRLAARKAEQEAIRGTVRSNRDPLLREAKALRQEQRATARKEQLAGREREATQREVERMEGEGGRAYRKGGAVKATRKAAPAMKVSKPAMRVSKPAKKAAPAKMAKGRRG